MTACKHGVPDCVYCVRCDVEKQQERLRKANNQPQESFMDAWVRAKKDLDLLREAWLRSVGEANKKNVPEGDGSAA